MKVFISWSGEISKAVAELLNKWLPTVINDIQPYFSEEHVPSGSMWWDELNKELAGQKAGIAVLTPDNKDSPWIHYECGALAKGLSENRIYTLLVDLKTTDVAQPLGSMNGTLPTERGMRKLINDINDMLEQPRDKGRLNDAFEMVWPRFESALSEIIKSSPKVTTEVPATQADNNRLIEELVSTVRRMDKELARFTSNLMVPSLPSERSLLEDSEAIIRPMSFVTKLLNPIKPLYSKVYLKRLTDSATQDSLARAIRIANVTISDSIKVGQSSGRTVLQVPAQISTGEVKQLRTMLNSLDWDLDFGAEITTNDLTKTSEKLSSRIELKRLRDDADEASLKAALQDVRKITGFRFILHNNLMDLPDLVYAGKLREGDLLQIRPIMNQHGWSFNLPSDESDSEGVELPNIK